MIKKEEKFEIKYDETKLANKEIKAQYLLKILKETSPLISKKQKPTFDDLLLSELKLHMQQKQSICTRKTKKMDQLTKEFDDLSQQIRNQKDLTSKYQKKIQIHLKNIEKDAKSELNLLVKQRIQKEVDFVRKIDEKLSTLTSEFQDYKLKTDENHQVKRSVHFKEIQQKLKTQKKKLQQISIQLTQNQNNLLKQISRKIVVLRGMFVKLESETSKLDILLDQIEQFQKTIATTIRKMKQQRSEKEKQTIELIEKIITVLDKRSYETVSS